MLWRLESDSRFQMPLARAGAVRQEDVRHALCFCAGHSFPTLSPERLVPPSFPLNFSTLPICLGNNRDRICVGSFPHAARGPRPKKCRPRLHSKSFLQVRIESRSRRSWLRAAETKPFTVPSTQSRDPSKRREAKVHSCRMNSNASCLDAIHISELRSARVEKQTPCLAVKDQFGACLRVTRLNIL